MNLHNQRHLLPHTSPIPEELADGQTGRKTEYPKQQVVKFLDFTNYVYATKKMKTTRKNIKMANIFIMSHLFDDIWLRCLNKALRAPSTFANDSSILSSILLVSTGEIRYYMTCESQLDIQE